MSTNAMNVLLHLLQWQMVRVKPPLCNKILRDLAQQQMWRVETRTQSHGFIRRNQGEWSHQKLRASGCSNALTVASASNFSDHD